MKNVAVIVSHAEAKDDRFTLRIYENSKRSDRELAKVVGVSQPTITRIRNNLEKSGYIREYTIIPALEKLGFEIIALTFLSASTTQEPVKEIQGWISRNSKILFSSLGDGLGGKTVLLVSIHKDFTDFSLFTRELRNSLGPKVVSIESFLVSLKTEVLKHFSFENLERI